VRAPTDASLLRNAVLSRVVVVTYPKLLVVVTVVVSSQ
jgi:hypothetical protein